MILYPPLSVHISSHTAPTTTLTSTNWSIPGDNSGGKKQLYSHFRTFLITFQHLLFSDLMRCQELFYSDWSYLHKSFFKHISDWFSRFLPWKWLMTDYSDTFKLWHCHQSTASLWWSSLILLIDVIHKYIFKIFKYIYIFSCIPCSLNFPLFNVQTACVIYGMKILGSFNILYFHGHWLVHIYSTKTHILYDIKSDDLHAHTHTCRGSIIYTVPQRLMYSNIIISWYVVNMLIILVYSILKWLSRAEGVLFFRLFYKTTKTTFWKHASITVDCTAVPL